MGSDFDHFNKDSEYYQETQAYFRLALAISAVIASLSVPTEAWKTGMANLGLNASTMSNVGTVTTAYNTYAIAVSVNDIITMNDKYNEMYADLKEKVFDENWLEGNKTSYDKEIIRQRTKTMEKSVAILQRYIQEYKDILVNMFKLLKDGNVKQLELMYDKGTLKWGRS